MKKQSILTQIPAIVLIGLFVFTNSCDSETVSPTANSNGDPQQGTGEMAAPEAASISTVPVLTFSDMKEMGESKLVRTDDGVSFKLSTTGLEPGTVHTLWIVIFNKPENCVDGCGDDDLFNPDVKPDLAYGAGSIIGDSGRAAFSGHQNEGDTTESIMQEWLDLPEYGIMNAREAEIHFVVHSHGPIIPDLVNEMLHSFNAGCGPEFIEGLPDVPESLGTYGPNTCKDVQFAVHTPSE